MEGGGREIERNERRREREKGKGKREGGLGKGCLLLNGGLVTPLVVPLCSRPRKRKTLS